MGGNATAVFPVSETDDVLSPLEVFLSSTYREGLIETVIEIRLSFGGKVTGLLNHIPQEDVLPLLSDVQVEVHEAGLVKAHKADSVFRGHEVVEECEDLSDGVQFLVQEVHRLRHV